MKNLSSHTGTLVVIQREKSSINGNPRYLCFIDETGKGHGPRFYTAPDSSYGYSITNYENCRVELTIGTYYGKPTLNSIKKV